MSKATRYGLRGFLLAMGVCAALLLWTAVESRYGLVCTSYTLPSSRITEPIRLLQLTDLHHRTFGKDNRRLIEMTAAQQPDAIVMTGDMLNGYEERVEDIAALIRALTQIAPVYLSYGNHERMHEETYGSNLKAVFEQSGAHVLEFAYEDVVIGRQSIRIGGLFGYCLPERYLRTGEAKPEEIEFLTRFQDTSLHTVLLCHMPLSFIHNGILDDWEIDSVLCGHAHGGQIRLPALGGLYAPDQGFFPGRVWGIYESSDARRAMVLSRGLGSAGRIPRLNNVPEVVVVDLLPTQ